MLPFAKIYFIVFGLLTIVGGYLGYSRAGSMASLIAGSVSGLLLAAGGWLLRADATPINIGLALISALLLFRFGGAFLKTQAFMPAGLMSALSLVGLILAAAVFFTRPSN